MENQTVESNDTVFPPSFPEILERFAPEITQVDKIISPIWYVIGFLGNPVVAKVWLSRKTRMNNSSAIYVGTLAIAQTVFLFLHLIMELHFVWHFRLLHKPFLCETFNICIIMPQYLTPLLVLAFTVERYIAINHPFQKEKLCTVRRAIYVTIMLSFLSLFLSSLQAYIWSFDETMDACVFTATIDIMKFEKYWTMVTESLLFVVVPLCVLVCNILVIKEIRRVTSEGPMAFQSNSSNSGVPTLTITLLSVSFYLICTLLPASIVYTLQTVFSPDPETSLGTFDEIAVDPVWQSFFKYLTVRKIVEEICLSNYACYFFIYCITGPHFRREVQEMLRLTACLKTLKIKRRTSSYHSEKSEYTLITAKSKTDGEGTATRV